MLSAGVLWKNLALSLIALLVGTGISELIVRSFVQVRDVGPSFTVYDPVYGQTLKKASPLGESRLNLQCDSLPIRTDFEDQS